MRSLPTMMLALCLPVSVAAGQTVIERTDVIISNGEIELAGTVLVPGASGPFPGLILVHGSGPGERSALLEVATRFASEGIAVLIYDKRGSGHSGGNWITSSLTDLASDAAAVFRFLVDQPQIDSRRSGFWGISQGGWIAPLAANMTSPAFVIAVTGGGLSPHELETAGYRAIVRNTDSSGTAADDANVLIEAYFDYLAGSISYESLTDIIEGFRSEAWLSAMGIERVIPGPKNRSNWEWVATFEPQKSIQELTVPALVLLGAKDPLTPADNTARAWRESLSSDIANSQVIVFQDAGHGMRTGGHGGDFVADYFTTQFEWLRVIGVLRDVP